MTPREVFAATIGLFRGNDWIQHAAAVDSSGNVCEIDSHAAIGFCLLGAVEFCCQGDRELNTVCTQILAKAIDAEYTDDVIDWNDADERRKSDVIELLEQIAQ